MNGEILIENLVVNCIIGILSHERATPQRLRLDVVLQTDFSASAASDRVEDTVNYAQIADELTQLAVEGQLWLVEAFTRPRPKNGQRVTEDDRTYHVEPKDRYRVIW